MKKQYAGDIGDYKIKLEPLKIRFSVCKVIDYSCIDLMESFCFTGTTDDGIFWSARNLLSQATQ